MRAFAAVFAASAEDRQPVQHEDERQMRRVEQVKHPFVDAQARIGADVDERQREQCEHLRGKAHAEELVSPARP